MAANTPDPEVSRLAIDPSTAALFQDNWTLYRKMVDNNLLFHREAYGRLHRVLIDEVARPFRFLDIACGDASASVGALRGTQISEYRGIDFSAQALSTARRALGRLQCRIVLEQADFLEALPGRTDLADVAWIGLSLHHLHAPQKLEFLRQVRDVLPDDGLLLIYENTSREGEGRDAWLTRWDLQRPNWTVYSEAEWETVAGHVHAADFPEAESTWLRFGHEAGFIRSRRLYRSPTELFALYCYDC